MYSMNLETKWSGGKGKEGVRKESARSIDKNILKIQYTTNNIKVYENSLIKLVLFCTMYIMNKCN